MNIELSKMKNGVMMAMAGTLFETGVAETFAKTARQALAERPAFMVLNFSESSLPDSRFLSRMIEIHNENKKQGGITYLFCGNNEDAIELFQINFLDKIMPMVDSLEKLS